MKPPVEHVRVSAKGKDILIKVKRRTGLEHWNEICRVALCRSLSNLTPPTTGEKVGESTIDMDWKTFAGPYQQEFTSLLLVRAHKDGIDFLNNERFAEYFRAHLERGISMLQNIGSLQYLYK